MKRGLLLFGLAAALSGFTVLRGISPHDEGLMLSAAARMASGQWPFRDFWWNYGPGQPLMLAATVKLFGPSLLTWRIVRLVLDGVVSVLAYGLVRREASRRLALLAWVAVAGAMAFPSGPGPNPPALALAFGGLLLGRARPAAGGALVGAAALFRPEIGAAVGLGGILTRADGRRRFALAAVGVAAVTWLPFVVAGGTDLFDQLGGFFAIQHLQRLPFPLGYDGPLRPSKVLEFYLPLVLLLSTAVWVAAVAVGHRWRRAQAWELAPLALVGTLYLLGRTDEFHLVPLAAVLPIALAVAVAAQPERRRAVRLALVGALVVLAAAGLERRVGQALHPPALSRLDLPVADGVRDAPDDARALARLGAYVNRRLPPGAPIFVANPRFDLVRVGDPLLYVLLDRPNPTRYDVMQPGVVTTREVQEEIRASLQQARPALVVRWLDPTADRPEPNGAGRSSGVRVLDSYLTATYTQEARFGDYAVLRRRSASADERRLQSSP